jgi:hypothetical protein
MNPDRILAYPSDFTSKTGAMQTAVAVGLIGGYNPSVPAGPYRRAAADDDTGEVRAVELDGHPFFVATRFQPERAALRGETAPLVVAFLQACVSRVSGSPPKQTAFAAR